MNGLLSPYAPAPMAESPRRPARARRPRRDGGYAEAERAALLALAAILAPGR